MLDHDDVEAAVGNGQLGTGRVPRQPIQAETGEGLRRRLEHHLPTLSKTIMNQQFQTKTVVSILTAIRLIIEAYLWPKIQAISGNLISITEAHRRISIIDESTRSWSINKTAKDLKRQQSTWLFSKNANYRKLEKVRRPKNETS